MWIICSVALKTTECPSALCDWLWILCEIGFIQKGNFLLARFLSLSHPLWYILFLSETTICCDVEDTVSQCCGLKANPIIWGHRLKKEIYININLILFRTKKLHHFVILFLLCQLYRHRKSLHFLSRDYAKPGLSSDHIRILSYTSGRLQWKWLWTQHTILL